MSLESYESTKLIWEVVTTRLLNEKFMTLWKIEGFYFYCFYVIRPNFHYVSMHQHQSYVYEVRFFQKYLKL
jgi:hypothetical protein